MTGPKPYGYGGKPNRLEREARLVLVEELMFRRIKPPGEVQRILSNEFGVNERRIRYYMQQVRERASLAAEMDPDRLTRQRLTESIVGTLNMALDKVTIVDGRSVPTPDLRTALRCQMALIDLHGLKAPQRHEITGAGGIPLTMGTSQAEAEALVQAAIDRVTAARADKKDPTE